MILQTPQWSRSMKQERTIVKAGAEKKIAVQSPSGILATACRKRVETVILVINPHLEYPQQEEATQHSLGRHPQSGGSVGSAEDVVLPHHHHRDHGHQLGDAPDTEELPGVHVWDVLDHHVAGGEAQPGQDGAAEAEPDEGSRGVVWESSAGPALAAQILRVTLHVSGSDSGSGTPAPRIQQTTPPLLLLRSRPGHYLLPNVELDGLLTTGGQQRTSF